MKLNQGHFLKKRMFAFLLLPGFQFRPMEPPLAQAFHKALDAGAALLRWGAGPTDGMRQGEEWWLTCGKI